MTEKNKRCTTMGDVVIYRAQIPVQERLGTMIEGLKKQASYVVDPGLLRWTEEVLIESQGSRNSVCVTKNGLLASWKMQVLGSEGKYVGSGLELGRKTKVGDVVEVLATRMALEVMAEEQDFQHLPDYIKGHKLKEKDILSACFGEYPSYVFNEEDFSGGGKLFYQAFIPVPVSCAVTYAACVKSAEVDENAGVITVGNVITGGDIKAERQGNGEWEAIKSIVGFPYHRIFPSNARIDDIVYELAREITLANLTEKELLRHIQKSNPEASVDYARTTEGALVYVRPDDTRFPSSDDNLVIG